MSYKDKQQIGDCTLYLGDCTEVMPTLEQVNAVVTDPPYGIGEAAGKNKSRSVLADSTDYGHSKWDDNPIDQKIIDNLLTYKYQIIFGGNYYDLPPTSCFLIWDKENGNNDFADCELAWTNLDKAVRKINWLWHGMIRKGNEKRYHPTQKPVGVMQWSIGYLPNDAKTILDPFMGSGTTGVACAKMGRQFIGIELERRYFDIACQRIEEAYQQPDFFTKSPKSDGPVQERFFDEQ